MALLAGTLGALLACVSNTENKPTREQLVETLADMADVAARFGVWRERWTQVVDSAIAELKESHND
jgi:hypothetical protein